MKEYPAIPSKDNMVLKETVMNEAQDNFVDFYEFCGNSNKILKTTPAYYGMNLPGSINKCYMRSHVAEMILEAAEDLPQGYCFQIYDAWRPFQVQEDLFNNYMERLSALPENKGKTSEQLHELTKKFVSYPSKDCNKPYVHSTGGAVDLTIVDEKGWELDMGTKFDDFSNKAGIAYYETLREENSTNTNYETIRNNRRLLYSIMTKVGFTNFPSEWWHYDYGDQFWSNESKKPAMYKGVLYVEDLGC